MGNVDKLSSEDLELKNSNLLVSIIIPAYNGEAYLQECLDSLLNQTYDNIQIIIVNDGSVDATGDILAEYAKKDERIVAINQKNQGTSAARNVGIEKATGDFITFVDCDDYLLSDCVEKIVEAIASTPEASVVVWNSQTFGEGDVVCSGATDYIYRGCDYTKYVLENRGGAGGVCGKAYKADIIKDNGIKFANVKTAEDGLFNTACLKYLNVVVSMSYVGYMYRKEDHFIHSATKFYNREGFFKSSVESASARLVLLREAMDAFAITDDKYKKMYYESEYYTFEVVKDENLLNNKSFTNKVKCSELLLKEVISLEAIEMQEKVWNKKWLSRICKKKSGLGLVIWQFSQIHYIKVLMVNTIFGRWFPKNTTRGKVMRKILGR